MGKIYDSVEELIGGTPLVRLHRLEQRYHLDCQILAKLERQNPGGSIKDRAAVQMLDDAQQQGILNPNSVIIEPTSGNTGIGLAMVCATRGYRCIIVMPDTMSIERRKLMLGYDAELVLTPGAEGMQGAVKRAEELAAQIPNSFLPGQFSNPSNALAHYRTTGPEIWQDTDGMQGAVKRAEELAAQIPNSFLPGQFSNPSNALAHYRTTGPEIWQDTDGRVDLLVAGVGTGGTISGVGRYLKEQNPSIHIIAAEPAASPLLSQGYAAPHGIQGIGANFIPSVLDTKIYGRACSISPAQPRVCRTPRHSRHRGELHPLGFGHQDL